MRKSCLRTLLIFALVFALCSRYDTYLPITKERNAMTIEETIALAVEEAEELAVQAAPEDLLFGIVDRECGPAVLADLLAHELAASHRLMQRIAAATHGVLSWSRSRDAGGAEETAAQPVNNNAPADL